MTPTYRVRAATTDDIPTLVAYRRAMFESMGDFDDDRLSAMCTAMSDYLRQAIPSGEYHGWVAEADGQIIASGGLVIRVLPPSPRNLDGREGYILNIYTVPAWRRRGVATTIMKVILDYLQQMGIPVATLHASPAGRPIYEKLGFQPTNEMRSILNNGCQKITG